MKKKKKHANAHSFPFKAKLHCGFMLVENLTDLIYVSEHS